MTLRNVEDVYALTPMQAGMVYHAIREPSSGAFVVQYHCHIAGALDPARFQAAWDDVLQLHPALRTAFLWDGLDEPLQVVRGEVESGWRREDWRALGDEARGRWDEYLRADRIEGLDLARAPVMRMALVRTGEAEWRFLWTFHHALIDGWSLPLVIRDVFAAYASRSAGGPPRLPAPRPFREYVAWLQDRDVEAARAFWLDALGDVAEPTPLGVDGAGRPRRQGHDRHDRWLSEETTAALTALARAHRVTLNTVVQGAWALLLHRYSGSDDVVFGSTDSGRPTELEGVEEMVGPFIRTHPVRVGVEGAERLGPWLGALQRHLVEARDAAHLPLVEMQRCSGVPAGAPLFESLVVFENYPESGDRLGADAGLEVDDIRFVEQSNFPLAVLFIPGRRLQVEFVYDTGRFDDGVIARMGVHLETLLEAMTRSPDVALDGLGILPAEERATLVDRWSGSGETVDARETVLQQVRARAREAPEAPAVTLRDRTLTYGALVDAADRVAGALEARGQAGRPVGLCGDPTPELIAGLLGILSAGSAYVPLDPVYPTDRLTTMLEASGATLALADGGGAERLPDGAEVLPLEEALLGPGPAAAPDEGAARALAPDALAYVIFTSGSTGTPKGVGVTHGNLAASTAARDRVYDEPVGAFLLLSSLSFDSSVAGLFWTLCTGGRLVLTPRRLEQDLTALAEMIEGQRVTHTLLLPSLWDLLLGEASASVRSLRTVVVAGEACPASVVERHHRVLPGVALYNEYGPTEATVWATAHRTVPADGRGSVPIGRPVPGAQVRVLDPDGRLLPAGAAGELYVGGAGVTPGYLGRPDETARRFVDDPFRPGARLYRTGDRVRFRSDGVLDFLGRTDAQVKIRGQRVEPGEVETALRRQPGVQDAVVAAGSGPGGSAQRLVAWVVRDAEGPGAPTDRPGESHGSPLGAPTRGSAGGPHSAPSAAAWTRRLRDALANALPPAMVPAAVVALDALPRLPNGKVDRRALPAPDAGTTRAVRGDGGAVATGTARSETERTLARVWAEVLGVERVGVDDHFFELGGDSILSIRLISRIRQAGLAVAPADLFERPTVRALAEVVEASTGGDEAAGPDPGPIPLLPVQSWFFETHRAAPHHWNQAYRLESPPDLDDGALRAALERVVAHHDALRTSFRVGSGRVEAEVVPVDEVASGRSEPEGDEAIGRASTDALPLLTLVDLGERDTPVGARAEVAAALHADFDLARPPLLRAARIRFGSGRPDEVLVVAHHLVVDGVSWPILLEDLATAYRAAAAGEDRPLPARTASIRAWARHLATLAEAPALRSELGFWEDRLRDRPGLPLDRTGGPPPTEASAETESVGLDAETTDRLLTEAHGAYNTRVDDLLLTALARAVTVRTGERTLVLEREGHGRRAHVGEGPDVSRTVGWFTAVHPLRLVLPSTNDPGEAIKSVKEQIRAVPGDGLGYGLLRYGSADGRTALEPLGAPELVFNYLGRLDRAPMEVAPFRNPTFDRTHARSPVGERPHRLEVNAAASDGRLRVDWTWDRGSFDPNTVQALSARFVEELETLVEHCTSGAGGFTPSDFPEAGMSQADLDRFLEGLG